MHPNHLDVMEVHLLRRGCEILADALRLNGVDLVFHVPEESFLSVLDALGRQGDGIKTITCRHENGMAIMAEAYGKLTGRPGIAFATRSPGAPTRPAAPTLHFRIPHR